MTTPQEPASASPAPDAAGTTATTGDPTEASGAARPVEGKARPKGSAKVRKKAGKAGRKIGPEARERAYHMLAEGFSCSAVARDMKVRVETIIAWRDSVEGEERIKVLRAQRNEELGATLKQGRLDLERLVPRAITTLGDALSSSNPSVKVRAAREILDRAGLPRTEVHEQHGDGTLDLSGLTPEELDVLRTLHAKAAKGAESRG